MTQLQLRWIVCFLVSTLTAWSAGCANHGVKKESDAAANSAVEEAFKELAMQRQDSSSVRSPASARNPLKPSGPFQQILNAQLEDLNPGFQVVVFPKVSNMATMAEVQPTLEYGSPLFYEIHPSFPATNCRHLLASANKKGASKAYFSGEIFEDMSCAILSIKETGRPLASMSRDDIASATVYIDSDYHVHGVDLHVIESRGKKPEIRRLAWNPKDPFSSGLTSLPVDVPAMRSINRTPTRISLPEDAYVQNKVKNLGLRKLEYGSAVCDQGYSFSYRDVYGAKVRVGWCKGDSWPTTIENDHFFSLLVRGQ